MNLRFPFLFLLLFISCNTNNPAPAVSNDWKKDMHGCEGLRNIELAEKLIAENRLKGKDSDAFLNIFGKPDQVRSGLFEKTLIYYFDIICDGNTPGKDSDKCYAEFYFLNGNLESYNFVCE